jgi:hypothetical protein
MRCWSFGIAIAILKILNKEWSARFLPLLSEFLNDLPEKVSITISRTILHSPLPLVWRWFGPFSPIWNGAPIHPLQSTFLYVPETSNVWWKSSVKSRFKIEFWMKITQTCFVIKSSNNFGLISDKIWNRQTFQKVLSLIRQSEPFLSWVAICGISIMSDCRLWGHSK